ncbi:MAG: tetratricopeptide repeat protein [Bacteroidales bacterium]|nr:tetratricopeptide repeat protein [Bacteroidales bacterium]
MNLKKYTPHIIITIFAFIIYANTLGHQYALDDKMTYWKNEFVQEGVGGIKDILSYDTMAGMFGKDSKELEGGRYRPLSLITFALEVELFGKPTTDVSAKQEFMGNPGLSHFINIILYCISLLILFKTLTKLFRDYKPKFWYLGIPFIATMLFAAHPLHTEIVANIKGRDEILAFLFSIAALNSILNYIDHNKKTELINAFVFIFLGSMSKEISITFLAVIPISIYFFRKEKLPKYIISFVPILAGALLYLIIRQLVIGDQADIAATQLMNDPFLEATTGQRYATIFYTLLLYLKLLIFPHPLTWDYYPYHIGIMQWSDWTVLLGLVLYLALGIVAILRLKKKSIYSFAIIIYLATLSITSNILFSIGAFMSERFIFVSLLGFCIVVAYLISEKLPLKINHLQNYRKTGLTITILILLAFSVKTVSRNSVWENNLTLFGHDVKVSSNSAKGNSSYASELYKLSEDAEAVGDTLLRNEYLEKAIPYFEKAIEIYPQYSEALVRLGNIHYKLNGDYKTMFDYYIRTLRTNPLNSDIWNNTIGVLTYNVDEPLYEKNIWLQYMSFAPERAEPYTQIGDLHYFTEIANPDSAVYYYEKAIEITPQNFELLFRLGVTYGNIGEFITAREYLQKAASIKEDAEVFRYLGITYGMEGNDTMALEYFEKALKLNPGNIILKQNVEVAKDRLNHN